LRKEKKTTIVEEAQRREKNGKVRSSFWFRRESCSERDGVNKFDLVWMDHSKIWWYNLI